MKQRPTTDRRSRYPRDPWFRDFQQGVFMPRICSLFAVLVAAGAAHAEDWPQWLGPRRDGSSAEKVTAWKGPLKVLWTKPVGEGHSSPVVADGKVFLHTKVKDKNEEQLTAFDALKGEVLW